MRVMPLHKLAEDIPEDYVPPQQLIADVGVKVSGRHIMNGGSNSQQSETLPGTSFCCWNRKAPTSLWPTIADLFNVLNLLDGEWGVRRSIGATPVLRLVGYDTGNQRGSTCSSPVIPTTERQCRPLLHHVEVG